MNTIPLVAGVGGGLVVRARRFLLPGRGPPTELCLTRPETIFCHPPGLCVPSLVPPGLPLPQKSPATLSGSSRHLSLPPPAVLAGEHGAGGKKIKRTSTQTGKP